jgi:hypothetical protein
MNGMAAHTLVVYAGTARADAALRELADSGEGRITVVRLVAQEPDKSGCCDTRSVLWNEISRDLGREALARDADEIVLADVRATPLGPLARRRLRRRSPVPIRAA